MERIVKYFEELGFGKNEIEVYLALVKLGKASVTEIYKKTTIHRQNIYNALDSLTSKGFVYILDNETKEYYPQSPDSLVRFIERKKVETKEIVEELNALKSKDQFSSIGKTKGKFSLKEELFSMLEETKTLYIIGMQESFFTHLEANISHLNKKVMQKKIDLRIITNKNVTQKCKDTFSKNIPIKNLKQKYDATVTTIISDDKLMYVLWTIKPTINVITSEIIAKQNQIYFDLLWSQCS